MKTELIHTLTASFEGHAQQTEGGVEYWLARDLQHLLGYAEWRNFSNTVISKAKPACEVSGHAVADHFVDSTKWSNSAPAASAKWTTSCSPATVTRAGLPFKVLDEHVETTSGQALREHDASSQGTGVSRSRGDGLRRRGDSAAGAD